MIFIKLLLMYQTVPFFSEKGVILYNTNRVGIYFGQNVEYNNTCTGSIIIFDNKLHIIFGKYKDERRLKLPAKLIKLL